MNTSEDLIFFRKVSLHKSSHFIDNESSSYWVVYYRSIFYAGSCIVALYLLSLGWLPRIVDSKVRPSCTNIQNYTVLAIIVAFPYVHCIGGETRKTRLFCSNFSILCIMCFTVSFV
jgi:hypothetical protein